MEISPAVNNLGGSEEAPVPTDVDICRICQSPEEEPDNPLKHPCACRGSLKFVHTDCLFLWIDLRKSRLCEICNRSYSIVPLYAKNAPERLSCFELFMSLLLRAFSFIRLILPWIVVIPFNAFFYSLNPLEKEGYFEDYGVFVLISTCPGLFYTAKIVFHISSMVVLMVFVEEVVRTNPELLRRVVIMENRLRQIDDTGIVLLLGKYMRILCCWWHDQLVKLPYFHRGPLALRFVPRNVQLNEFGAIRRLLFFLDDNSFAVLAINIFWSFLYLLLPFSIGRVVLVLLRCSPRGWIWENSSEVTVGSVVILSAFFSYFRSVFILPQITTRPNRIRRFSLSFKDTCILCFKISVLPWVLGLWLDFCAFPITGKLLSHKLEDLTDYPLMAARHCCIGELYLVLALSCMHHLPRMVQKRVFWYIQDVTEPNYNVTKLRLGPVLFTVAFHGAVVVIVLHLPIRTINFLSRSFFPLQIGVYDDGLVLGILCAYMCITSFGPWQLANFLRPAIKPIVHKWLITVSSWLKLSDFLLEVPQRDHANHVVRLRFVVFGLAEGSMVSLHGSPDDTTSEEDINFQRDERFKLRIGLMLVLAALSMFLISTTFMALPILVGRAFFNSISFFMLSFGLKHDDVCAFLTGFCILRGAYIIICFIYDHIVTGRTNLLFNHVMLCIQNGLLFSIWISVIPGLLGLLIDLMIIIPSQVPLEESPVYDLPHDWLMGKVVLDIWIFLIMLTPINNFGSVAWREKVKRIKSVGINQLPFKWLIIDVTGSTKKTLLIPLCLPYVLAYFLFPILGFSGAANFTVQRFIWPAFLSLIILWYSVKLTHALIIYLHRVEFNNRYKVGEKLVDFTEDLE